MSSNLKNEIISLRKKGLTYNEIKDKLKCAKSTISHHCKKEGVGSASFVVTQESIDKMQSLYNKYKSCEKVAQELSVSKSTVLRYVETISKDPLSLEERKKRNVKAVQRRRLKIKGMAVEYKGGKCKCCGYSKYQGALEFHHLDPSEKDFNFSQKGHCRSWEKVKIELDKCILVCANCHREIHAGLIKL
jgi:biotin operon repressor